MATAPNPLRALPAVEALLQHPMLTEALAELPRPLVVEAVRAELSDERERLKARRRAKAPAPADATFAERAAKFDKLDAAKTGKLTREYYTTHQSDRDAAAKRFEKFDADKDGLVTREEYIRNGAKKLKPN